MIKLCTSTKYEDYGVNVCVLYSTSQDPVVGLAFGRDDRFKKSRPMVESTIEMITYDYSG